MSILFEFAVSVLSLAVGIVFLVQSLFLNLESDFPLLEGPAIFPLVFAGFVIIISIKLLYDLFFKKRDELFDTMKKAGSLFMEEIESYKKLGIIILATFLYIVVLMPLTNFCISTTVFMLFCLIYFGKVKPIRSILISAATSYAIYFVFMKLLCIYLP